MKISIVRLIPEDAKVAAWTLACEGSVDITKGRSRTCRQGFTFHPCITLWNTDSELVQNFRKMVGCGSIYRRKMKNPNHRDEFSWRIHSFSEVISFIEEILPFAPSSVFRRKCELILEYCRSRIGKKKHKAPYTQDEIELYEEMRRLNVRGITKRKYL